MSARVAIIVLNWNGKSLTLECLDSLQVLDYPSAEIMVVDNASTDGSVEAIRERYGDNITVIANESNLGFSQGNNVGIERALRDGADFILLLNNDTVVDPQLVTHLVDPLIAEPKIGISGPKIYYYDPPDQIWFAGGEVFLGRGITRHVGIRETDTGQFDRRADTDYITGCALMAGRAVFEKVGLLDPSYRAYFEDTDFCMRARRAGFRIVYVPEGKVWHKVSASTGGQMSRQKIVRKFHSSWRFFGRHARPYHWLSIPLFFAFDVLRIAFLVTFGRIRNTNPNPQ